MEVSGQLHTPATLPTGNKPGTHRQEAEWSSELVYMFGRRGKYLMYQLICVNHHSSP